MTATGLERRLRAAAGAGEWLDLADDPDREMDAGLLRALLVGDAPIAGGDPVPPRAVRVRGARIAGSLELEGRRLVCSLHLADCEAESPIVLREATAPAIRLHGCAIASLSAAELQTRGNLELDRCRIGGELNLMRAHIAGQLSLTGAQLAGHAGVALNADGLRVGGGMICRRVSAKGEVRLLDAHVTGVLTLAGAELAHEGAAALGADRLQVDGDMFCEALGADRFMANGEIRLLGAHIGGQLSLAGADLANTGGTALHADGIRVDDGIFAEPEGSHRFTVEGEIRLLGAHVGG